VDWEGYSAEERAKFLASSKENRVKMYEDVQVRRQTGGRRGGSRGGGCIPSVRVPLCPCVITMSQRITAPLHLACRPK